MNRQVVEGKSLAPKVKGMSALIITAAFWGSSFPAIKFVVSIIDEAMYTWLRGTIALIGLSPYFFYHVLKNGINRRHLIGGIAAGAAFALGLWLQGWGTRYTSASNSAFITGLFIIFVLIYDALSSKRYSLSALASLLIAVTGIYLLTMPSGGIGIGELLVLMGAFFWAAQVIIVDRYSESNPLIFTFYEIMPTLLFVPLGLSRQNLSLDVVGIVLPPIIYLGLVSTNLGFILQVYGQRWLGPFEASLIMLFEPVFAAVFSALLLNESFSITWIIGAGLILAGMLLAVSKPILKHQK